MQTMIAIQAPGAYERVMEQMFEHVDTAPANVMRFRAAGDLTAVSPVMNAQDWAKQALNGAQLKRPYADIPMSGLLLLRDTLVRALT